MMRVCTWTEYVCIYNTRNSTWEHTRLTHINYCVASCFIMTCHGKYGSSVEALYQLSDDGASVNVVNLL